MDNVNTRNAERRNAARELITRNFPFGRTLSVGRLHHRVVRSPSFSDTTFSVLQQERVATEFHAIYGTRASNYQHHSVQNRDNEASQLRESRLRNLLRNRSNFMEHEGRIRSWANHLETLFGHQRSCTLFDRHGNGRCMCSVNDRVSNSDDDASNRASISRIVTLAEALFEVLHEIHLQSVELHSRFSVSSIGSIPAPGEVVESLPLKIYSKPTNFQEEEVGQCYICLVEYEDGDPLRILPCKHEFHKACVDKWLQEIHRVCPLCRGNICRSRSLSMGN